MSLSTSASLRPGSASFGDDAGMQVGDFHALKTGAVTQPDGAPAHLTVRDLGLLIVESGRLGHVTPSSSWISRLSRESTQARIQFESRSPTSPTTRTALT